jgi:type IX secretion system PorP/SprF family membrane protein
MSQKQYIFIFLIFMQSVLLCQDLHLTQFYSNPLYLNPAFTGANVCNRFGLVYRNQWPKISNGYVSYILTGDHYMPKMKSGVGLVLANDVAGSGQLRTTNALLSYAYETNLNKELAVRAGIQAGMGVKSVNMNSLLFGDQIARGGNVSTIETPAQSKYYFDSNAGVLFYSSTFYIGVSAFHLNRPNESLMGAEAKLPVKYSVHGGVKKVLNDAGRKDKYMNTYITPVVHYRHQEKFDQLDVGFYISKSHVNVGAWYRGIPLVKAYKPGYPNNDAVAFLFGITTDKFNFGYSYDFTISKLASFTNGAHEVSLTYQYCKKKKTKRILVSCPKF